MSWTEGQINELRDRMSLAKRVCEWLSAAETRLFLDLIAFWCRATLRSGFTGPADGLPPTMAATRAHGITHLFATCANPTCYGHRRPLAFEDLRMVGKPVPDSGVFVDLPNLCRFRCIKCNGWKVSLMADWPDMDEVSLQARREASR